MIARAVKFGVVPDADITLGSPSQWEELHRLWNETSKQVVDASVSRTRIAREVAQRRFAEGRYQAYEVDESTRLPNGGFDGPWNKTSHPDEIVSNTYMYRDGGGQIVHHVRFSPGDVPEIDEATAVLRLYEQLRREAVSQFLQQNKSKNGR